LAAAWDEYEFAIASGRGDASLAEMLSRNIMQKLASEATVAANGGPGLYAAADALSPKPAGFDYDNTTYAASQFELDVRAANIDALEASGGYDPNTIRVARDALAYNQVCSTVGRASPTAR
jgi:hypothetical protein